MNSQDNSQVERTSNVLRLPVSIGGRAGTAESGSREPARVLGFPLRGAHSRDSGSPKAAGEMTYKQKVVRIVDAAIGKLNDDQLDSLLIEVERITGNGG
jgi:hypothetical protein